ncbi:hypothetical protein OIU85_029973 [Salix viminalis]|uniref:Endonuclease/exonuclease/phosphatase domain-containing protein n=1 Tax=Salix viminalis TaxID=40686 RepID=A0A9Q0QCI5_SALVM|nr:hypothetical protein OIU85_029973 [Salix viminalis]
MKVVEDDKVGVVMVHSDSQWLTCDVTTLEDGSKIRVSFVYGLNSPLGRKALWDYLEQQKTPNNTIPWAILGDFNAILSSSDRHGGDDQWHSHMDDFPSCIDNSELIHVQTTGLQLGIMGSMLMPRSSDGWTGLLATKLS